MKPYLLIFFVSSFLFINISFSQCDFDNSNIGTVSFPSCPGNTTVTCMMGGDEIEVNVEIGNSYIFSTCGSTTFDSQLTLYDNTGLTNLGFDDDFCGSQSQITWVATYTGVVHILLDEYNCISNTTCMDLNIECTIPTAGGSGCNTDNTICSSGIAGPFGFGTAGVDPGNCQAWLSTSQFSYIPLYITQDGSLNILIAGDATTGYLDVSIYNIPSGVSPCDAFIPANLVGCNFASSSSGCNEFGTTFGCASSVPAPAVTAGQQLMIIVEDYGNGDSEDYTLELAPAPAAQTGPPDATIDPVGPFCSNAVPIQLSAANMGGDWTGPGVSSTGFFDPALAGTGTHTINYAIGMAPCNSSSSTTIVVNSSLSFTIAGTNPATCNATNGFIVISNLSPSTSHSTSYDDDGITQPTISIMTDASGTLTIPNLNAGTYTNFSLNSGLCAGTSSMIINLANPGAPNITNPGPQSACETYVLPTIIGSNLSGGQAYYNNSQALGGTLISGSLTNSQTVWIYDINGACSDEKNFILTINNSPTVSVSNQTICAGSPATITATPSTIGGTYAWSTQEITQSITVSPTLTTNYSLTYTLNGCQSPSVTSIVFVDQLPTVGVNNPNSCSGQTVPITATPQILGGTFLWNTNEMTSFINVSPLVTTNYTVVYTLNGCSSLPASGTVNVFQPPAPSAGPPLTICSGNTGNIGINPIIGYLYSWSPSTGLSNSNDASPSITLTNLTAVPVVTNYTVIVVSPQGCSSTDFVNVTVNPIPVANFTSDTTSGCTPLIVTFTNSSSPTGTTTFWDFGDGSNSISSAGTVTHMYTSLGCHDVTLTSTDLNCSSTLVVPQMICVTSGASAHFSVDKQSTSVFDPEFIFTNNSSDATTYKWDFGDGDSSTITNPNHLYEDVSAEYTVTLIASQNDLCQDTISVILEIRDELIYYIPNTFTPDNNNFNQTFQPVFTTGFDPFKFKMIIINRWGETVFETHDASIGWDGTYGGKIASEGSYTWRIDFKDSITDKKYTKTGNITLIR